MIVLLIGMCCTASDQSTYVVWAKAGAPIPQRPGLLTRAYCDSRNDIPSRSGKRHTYRLKIQEANSATLSMSDPGSPHNSFFSPNMYFILKLRQGEIFPFYNRLYLVKSVYFDESRPKARAKDQGKVTLVPYTSKDVPLPDPGTLLLPKNYEYGITLAQWDSKIGSRLEDKISLKKWSLDEPTGIVTLHLYESTHVVPRKRPEGSIKLVKLKQGDTFEVHGRKIVLKQVVPSRKLEDGNHLVGWIAFHEVKED